MTINELAKRVHATAKAKGWWDKERSVGECIALIHSELSEALEEWRTPAAKLSDIDISREGKPQGFSIELADAIIRILDLAEYHRLDVEKALRLKAEFNDSRPYRHGKSA